MVSGHSGSGVEFCLRLKEKEKLCFSVHIVYDIYSVFFSDRVGYIRLFDTQRLLWRSCRQGLRKPLWTVVVSPVVAQSTGAGTRFSLSPYIKFMEHDMELAKWEKVRSSPVDCKVAYVCIHVFIIG